MKQILIVEDDLDLREELKLLLEENGYTVEEITEFTNTKNQILASTADLILLDIVIPGINGEFLLREIRKTKTVPIIMLTSKNTEMDEILSFNYGADDYIAKPYHPTLLLLRIEAILKRGETKNLSYQNMLVHPEKSTIEIADQETELSKNEMKILVFLLEHQGTIVTREEIMDYLWNTEEFIDDNTLTVNINRLRKRLEELGFENVIETRRGQGYIIL